MIAIPKLGNSLDKTNLVKIKTDISMIRNGLIDHKNKMILLLDTKSLDSLEVSDIFLS